MKIFPQTLVRFSGGPFDELDQLNLKASVSILERVDQCNKKINEIKNRVNDLLFKLIPSLPDSKVQNTVLSFKRDLHNDKDINREKIKLVEDCLSPEIKGEVENYLVLYAEKKKLLEDGKVVFDKEMITTRQNLFGLASNKNLQKGLLLSSKVLLDNISQYLGKNYDKIGKKELQTEQGVIKYISRMYTKTSPFSTFTNLCIGDVSETPKKNADEKAEIKSHIRLNNYLYSYIRGLLFKNANIYRLLMLRPNPTIKNNNDHYLFLINSNNIESFQRIPANPVVELFFVATNEKKGGVVYKDLVAGVLDQIEASEEEIEAYLNQLIEYGFLEYNIGVSGIDPDWDKKLIEKLRPIEKEIPLIADLIKALITVRQFAEKYEAADLGERKQILDSAYAALRSVCMELHKAAGLPEEERFTPEEQRVFQKKKEEEKKAAEKEVAGAGKKEGEEGAKAAGAVAEEDSKDNKAEEEIIFKHQNSTYFHFKAEQIFYEDTSLSIAPQYKEAEIKEVLGSFNDLLQELAAFDWTMDEKEKMNHYFIKKHGEEGITDLLSFYENFYRDFKKPEAEYQKILKKSMEKQQEEAKKAAAEEEKNKLAMSNEQLANKKEEPAKPEPLPLPDELKVKKNEETAEFRKKWTDLFVAKMKEKKLGVDEIALEIEDVKKINKEFPATEKIARKNSSFGVFAQPYRDPVNPGKWIFVLNGSFPGFGKMFSRFLHIFDDTVTNNLREWNQKLTKEDLLLEDHDASFFNANLHPPLMPYEIWMPNGNNTLPADQQIPITEVELSYNKEEKQLQLTHIPTKKRVYVFDLGFQGHMGRSQLFQMLEKFSLAKYLGAYSLVNVLNSLSSPQSNEKNTTDKQSGKKPTILIKPRIIYEGRIVLQRKAWIIPKQLLPLRKPGEESWSYFARLSEWRISNHIPEETFIFITGRGDSENAKPEDKKKLGRDDYKPQYINFNNPFLVNLFEKSIEKVPAVLRIEEMLPGSKDLQKFNTNRYVTECVFQWYEYEK